MRGEGGGSFIPFHPSHSSASLGDRAAVVMASGAERIGRGAGSMAENAGAEVGIPRLVAAQHVAVEILINYEEKPNKFKGLYQRAP